MNPHLLHAGTNRLTTLLAVGALAACSGMETLDSQASGPEAAATSEVMGTVDPASGATFTVYASTAGRSSGGMSADPGVPEGCLDDSNGGVSGSHTPESVEVVFRRITLLGDTGTEDADLLRADSLEDAVSAEVAGTGAELALQLPPAGDYIGMEIELWNLAVPLPVSVPELPDGEEVLLRGWLASDGHIEQRDVTASLAGSAGLEDGEYWLDLDEGGLVAAFELEWDGAEDTGWDGYGEADTGLGAPGDATPEAPGQRLRMQYDETLFDQDPAVMTSESALQIVWDTNGQPLSIEEGQDAGMSLVFDLNETLLWWEALENDDIATADGEYTLGEDCGFHLSMPTLHVGMPEE